MSDAEASHAETAHEGLVVIRDIRTLDAPDEIGLLTLKFVHYPGAQQLILWLPQSGYHGYGDVTVTHDRTTIEHASVRNRLKGSVQILWDTLAWAPGDYLIIITHADAGATKRACRSSKRASLRWRPNHPRQSQCPRRRSSTAMASAR